MPPLRFEMCIRDRANIAIHFGGLRYFRCPKENIHFGNICHVAVDSAIHNPLGKPSGFLNRSITAPLPQKVTAALPEKKHSLVPPSVFSPSFLPTFCGRAPSARFVKSKEFKFGRLLHIAIDFAAAIPPKQTWAGFLLHRHHSFSPQRHVSFGHYHLCGVPFSKPQDLHLKGQCLIPP